MEFNVFFVNSQLLETITLGKEKLWEKGEEIGWEDSREMFPDKIDRLLIILF